MQVPPGNPLLLSLTLQELLARDAVQVELVPEKKGLFLKHVEYEVSSQVTCRPGGGGRCREDPQRVPLRPAPARRFCRASPGPGILPLGTRGCPWSPDELAPGSSAVLGSPWGEECGPRTAYPVHGRDWRGGLTPGGAASPAGAPQGQSASGAAILAPVAVRGLPGGALVFCPLPVRSSGGTCSFSWGLSHW